jgi:beta-phosphoglucomutase-like phosphatase (HAD superfamily)
VKNSKLELKKFQALILDMDGVLVDTEPVFFKSFTKVLKKYHIYLDTQYLHNLVGNSTRQNFQDISNDFGLELDIDNAVTQLEKVHLNILQKMKISANTGAWDLIDLAKKWGILVGLCTSSSSKVQRILLEKVVPTNGYSPLTDQLFDAIITGDDVRHKKPHPEPYLKIVAVLKVPPAACLVVEDSEAGIISAKAAGCNCVALRTSYNPDKDMSKADHVILNLKDLISS